MTTTESPLLIELMFLHGCFYIEILTEISKESGHSLIHYIFPQDLILYINFILFKRFAWNISAINEPTSMQVLHIKEYKRQARWKLYLILSVFLVNSRISFLLTQLRWIFFIGPIFRVFRNLEKRFKLWITWDQESSIEKYCHIRCPVYVKWMMLIIKFSLIPLTHHF